MKSKPSTKRPANPAGTCRVPGCSRPVGLSREVCSNCYASSKRLIDRKETTWEELERLGIVAPRKTMKICTSPVALALAAAHAKNGTKRHANGAARK